MRIFCARWISRGGHNTVLAKRYTRREKIHILKHTAKRPSALKDSRSLIFPIYAAAQIEMRTENMRIILVIPTYQSLCNTKINQSAAMANKSPHVFQKYFL